MRQLLKNPERFPKEYEAILKDPQTVETRQSLRCAGNPQGFLHLISDGHHGGLLKEKQHLGPYLATPKEIQSKYKASPRESQRNARDY